MELSKAELGVARLTAQGPHGYVIDHVLVEPDGKLVATDGRKLIVLTPAPDGQGKLPKQRLLVKGADLDTLAATLDDKSTVELGDITTASGARAVTWHHRPAGDASPIGVTVPHQAEGEGGHYPPYESVYPKGKPKVTITLDAAELIRLLGVIAPIVGAWCGTNEPARPVSIEVRGADEAIVIEHKGPDDQHIKAVMMPMTSE